MPLTRILFALTFTPHAIFFTTMNDDPTYQIIDRTRAHIEAAATSLTAVATSTGIGYYRLRRVILGETVKLSLNDARKLEEYLTGEGA